MRLQRLMTMYRQTVAMPQPEQSQVREQLRKYAQGVQGPEWGKQDFDLISKQGASRNDGNVSHRWQSGIQCRVEPC